jgi:hypothetical protein
MCDAEDRLEREDEVAQIRTEAKAEAASAIDQVVELAADVDRGVITTGELRTQAERIRGGRPVAIGALA